MRNLQFLLLVVTVLLGCEPKKQPILGDTEWQRQQNADFKDASKSPLTNRDRKLFRSLDFFPFDSTYIVSAKLKVTPDTPFFKMKTTTDRLSEERVYGIVSFTLNGKSYQLNVYQGKENLEDPEYVDYLFLPFLDDTNGGTSYGGGRYIDLRIPETDRISIDFNKAYNPLCVYNVKYSCPIVPRVNYLDTEVKVGMRNYIKE